jgi:hypothetical protein
MNHGPLIIGFGHRRRVGKDSLVSLVAETSEIHTDWRVARASFARRLKEEAHRLFRYAGLKGPEFYDANPEWREIPLPEIGKSPRELWIEIGNALRGVDPDIWIHNALADPNLKTKDVAFITDVRYPNEVSAIRALGGLVVKVIRPGVPDSSDMADSALADMPDGAWDRLAVNDGGLDDLARKADELARWVHGKLKTRYPDSGREP